VARGPTFLAAAARARLASSAARVRSWSATYASYISPWLHDPEADAVGGGSVAVARSAGGNTGVCVHASLFSMHPACTQHATRSSMHAAFTQKILSLMAYTSCPLQPLQHIVVSGCNVDRMI